MAIVLDGHGDNAQPEEPSIATASVNLQRDTTALMNLTCLNKCAMKTAFSGTDEQKAYVKQCLQRCNEYLKSLHQDKNKCQYIPQVVQ